MPKRDFNSASIEDFRRAVMCGLSPATLNEDLKQAVRSRCRATPVHEIVDALGSPARIDLEIIVDAAEYGHVDAVRALIGVVPAAAAQDYFDRALIGVAIYDIASEQEYLEIARDLIGHGANPEAYETTCRQLAGSSIRKEEIYELFCDVIEAQEDARNRAWRAESGAVSAIRPPQA
jgi:hypothetical protein